MTRRAWQALPTEATAEAADRRNQQAIAEPIDVVDVLAIEQATEYADVYVDVLPVRLVGPARVNRMGTRVGAMFSRRLEAAPAGSIRLLTADPRRAFVQISVNADLAGTFAIGRSQAEADDASAFFGVPNVIGPYRFYFANELWVRATGGTVRVSVLTEEWTG